MRDIAADLRRWWERGEPFALGTVVRTWSSAPREPGAAMAVDREGTVLGSVSGGCVEGAVHEAALEVLATGGARVEHYGVSGADAFAVGLTCGGEIDVLVHRVDPAVDAGIGVALECLLSDEPVAVCLVVRTTADGPAVGSLLTVRPHEVVGTLGSDRLDQAVTDDARGLLGAGRTGVLHYGPHGERRPDEIEVFVSSFAPRPRMIVFGAIDFARAVAQSGLCTAVTPCGSGGAAAPRTTTTGASPASRQACTATSSSRRPSCTTSAFGRPSRVPAPAARTSPAQVIPGSRRDRSPSR